MSVVAPPLPDDQVLRDSPPPTAFAVPPLQPRAVGGGASLRISFGQDDGSVAPLLSVVFGMTKSLRALLGFKLAGIGIAVGQDHLLWVLGMGQTMRTGELAAALCVRPSTVSKMSDRMVRDGWIEKAEDSRDARKVLIRLTPVGQHVRSQVLEIWNEIETDIRVCLPNAADVERQVAVVEAVLTRHLSRLR